MVLRALGSVVGCFLWSCALRTIPLQPTSFFPVPSHYRVMSKQERVAITKQNYTVPLTPIKKKLQVTLISHARTCSTRNTGSQTVLTEETSEGN